MDPITLRIQTDLLSEIESEAEDLGYSSRAEYIRQLLQNRHPAREMLSADGSVELVDPETVATNTEDIKELHQQLKATERRVKALEERIETRDDRSNTTTESEETNDSDSDSTSTSELETWIVEDGPQNETAGSIILFAAELLQENGPMKTGELKKELYEEFPDTYKSEDTLWGSTIGRVQQKAPGFSKPKYGTYDFE